ncbi:tRNA (guanine-N(1)-)-methyltransferase [Termitomyces sp. T112]|nr:hypothetical protein C0989_009216 [Termitomyces sp. Mn162]KAG5733262.1 tRNA (guanine-N(1)-)-methyltransferase [Termitomyces sp. T112]KAH0587937.1 hypothetical protein H2248_006688 [Termitomyces sp. 'cryptogamus']
MSDDQQRPVQPDTPEPGPPQSLSKNALKKAARAERFAAYKVERRAREKEAKKEKKRMLRAKCAAGEIGEDEKRRKKKPRLHFGGRVVVDLGFDDKMNEKEIKSLCSQLAYTYSANRNATYPFSLVYTSLNGRTLTRLEGMNDAGYKRWTNTEWWPESYERLWQGQEPRPAKTDEANDKDTEEASTILSDVSIDRTVGSQENIRHNIIYLTADSEEELTELKPEETYIIGGICDHNRYKNLCLKRAKESGIRTARLPIGRYLASLPTRKVLTVNQVFEILLKWVETKSWEEALYAVVPKRKYQIGKSVSSMANSDNAEDREDRDEDADKPDSSVVVIEQAEAVEA